MNEIEVKNELVKCGLNLHQTEFILKVFNKWYIEERNEEKKNEKYSFWKTENASLMIFFTWIITVPGLLWVLIIKFAKLIGL